MAQATSLLAAGTHALCAALDFSGHRTNPCLNLTLLGGVGGFGIQAMANQIDPVRGKPRRSGRGRIARTA